MSSGILELLLSPPLLAVLGLCVGSFLNVVIHRLPLMLERGWKLDSAEMLGVTLDTPPAVITLSTPRRLKRFFRLGYWHCWGCASAAF